MSLRFGPLYPACPQEDTIVQSILVIHSTLDDSVRDRIRAMELNADLRDFQLHHTYFFTPSDATALSLMKPQEFLAHNEFALTRRFHQLIASTNPDLVVLHTGVAFYIAPFTVLSIFETLKRTNPGRTFAIQKGHMYTNVIASEGPAVSRNVRQIFDQTPEVQDVVDRLF